jgi:hypothetical protein
MVATRNYIPQTWKDIGRFCSVIKEHIVACNFSFMKGGCFLNAHMIENIMPIVMSIMSFKMPILPFPHPILFYFILFYSSPEKEGEKSGHPQAEIFSGPWAGGKISHLSKMAIRNYTPHTIHGHKSHPNKKLFFFKFLTTKKKKKPPHLPILPPKKKETKIKSPTS